MSIPYQPMPNAVDANNVKLLSVFHFVMSGLTALFSCFPIIHIVLGVMMVSGTFQKMATASTAPGSPPPPPFPNEVGYLFIVMGSIAILVGWTIAVLMLVAGLKLRRMRSRTFCIVVAAIECLIFPFGTILGVFTLVVLMKDSVKAMFDGAPVSAHMPPPAYPSA